MGKVKFKLNLKGLNELMKGPEMQQILQEAGEVVEANARNMCPEGEYRTRTVGGKYIAKTYVSVDNGKAHRDNLENNTLEKALGAAGLPRTKK